MGDTNMNKTDDLVDYNIVDFDAGTAYNAPSNGKEGLPDLYLQANSTYFFFINQIELLIYQKNIL